ncbi:MAG: hypothetical protein KF777_11615 [Planctomycetaceae bacterium]|nr:hypothetical protein [Planctomycetaceae bacterium]
MKLIPDGCFSLAAGCWKLAATCWWLAAPHAAKLPAMFMAAGRVLSAATPRPLDASS